MSSFDEAIDKGLEGVTVCSTSVSAISNSKLYLRGWALETLAENSNFNEVTFLLWKGWLPKRKELEAWESQLGQYLELTSEEEKILKALPYKNVHPMAWLRTAVSACSLLEKEGVYNDLPSVEVLGMKLQVKMPLMISYFHCLRTNKEMLKPKKDKSLAWNFLYTLNSEAPSELFEKVLDICLILHADHGLNCSTFAARVTSSSLSDLASAIVSGIGTLKGPLHGGANEQVMKMLTKFSSKEQALDFIDEALKNKQKIMGFGHRIYKEVDPRAEILKKYSKEMTKETGQENLYLISEAIEEKIRKLKKLPPNVDFYSASVYHSMGLSSDLFTPIFAMSRVAGWVAHVLEQYSKNRIYRPLSRWLEEFDKKWIPLSER